MDALAEREKWDLRRNSTNSQASSLTSLYLCLHRYEQGRRLPIGRSGRPQMALSNPTLPQDGARLDAWNVTV